MKWTALPALGLAAVLTTAGCTASTQGDNVVLTFADGFSGAHPFGKYGTAVFVEEIEKNGPAVGIDIDLFPSSQLGAFEDMPRMLTSEVSDVSPIVPAYLSATAPMSSVFDLPGYVDDACVGASAMNRTVAEGSTLRTQEIDKLDVRPLYSAFLTGYELMTSTPVTEPQGQRGEILRSPGGAVDRVVKEMGAAGVSMPLNDLYEAVSRGTASGTVASPISIAPYGLAEVLRNSTVGSNLGSVGVLYSMSNQKWSELDDAQKAVVSDASDVAQQSLCSNLNTLLPTSTKKLEEQGTTLHYLSDDEKALWATEISEPARESWRTDLDSMGLPASEVLDEWQSALTEAESNE